MALERRRPLPAGRYWLDVTAGNRTQWETWREGMKGIPSVTIERVQHFEATESGWNPLAEGDLPAAPERDFVIFSLTAPNIAWEAAGLPSPNIAPPEVTGAEDVVQRPPPEPGALEQLQAAAGGVGTALKVGLGVGVGVAVVALAISVFKR